MAVRRTTGRQREATRVRRTLRAAAVGRLMLGELRDWTEFLEPDTHDFVAMHRRQLKALDKDARRRLTREVQRFCDDNFDGMTHATLDRLFDAIKAHRGLTMPRPAFEAEFAPLRDEVVRGSPRHAAVDISLWGLQFWFPEEHLANDLIQALRDAGTSMRALGPHYDARHSTLLAQRDEIRDLMRRRSYAARVGLLTAFNLLECHLNSMAWEFLQCDPDLSNRKRTLLEDAWGTTLRDKLLKYPEIIGGLPLSSDASQTAEAFLELLKPFRDSLVHPSPFDAPERFGGYDKLRLVYRVDVDTLFLATGMLVDLVERYEAQMRRAGSGPAVPWLDAVKEALEEHKTETPPEWRLGWPGVQSAHPGAETDR